MSNALSKFESGETPKEFIKGEKGRNESVVGIDIPYKEPISPEIIIETDKISIDSTSEIIFDKLKSLHLLKEHFLKK